MRARNIKPGLFKNEILGNADPLLTILFEGLWCMADREGRLEDRPLRITAEIFPYRRQVTERRCDRMLQELHNWSFIHRYEIGGRRYIQVVEFLKHQSPHSKEKPSIIPEPTSNVPRVSPLSEQGSDGASTGEAAGSTALNPDSGSRIADTGSLKPRTPGSAGLAGSGGPTYEQMRQLQAEYPKGIYRGVDWQLAEHQIAVLISDHGVEFDALLEAAIAYRKQQEAMKKIGTQFILRPSNFFEIGVGGRGAWCGPFDIPTDPDAATVDEAGVARFLKGGKL